MRSTTTVAADVATSTAIIVEVSVVAVGIEATVATRGVTVDAVDSEEVNEVEKVATAAVGGVVGHEASVGEVRPPHRSCLSPSASMS